MDSQGRCMCGGVRYSYSGEAIFTAVCHCRQCQRQTASAFSIVTGVPTAAFRLQGQTRIFEDMGESGKPVARHFCPNCGSPIMSILGSVPNLVFIKSGTLDNFANEVPTVEVFCESALPFLPELTGTDKFPRSNLGDEA